MYVYQRMGKDHFQFKNQEVYTKAQKQTFSFDKWLSQLVLFSSLFVFISFLALKIPRYFKTYKKSLPFFNTDSSSQKKAVEEITHSVPLFVNLKGDKGPQLVRVNVYLSVDESSKRELASQGNTLEKHILFLLSGQSAKALSSKKDHFEKQIHFHLNAFLSKKIVNAVHIQTQTMN